MIIDDDNIDENDTNLNSTSERSAPILTFTIDILTHRHQKVDNLGVGNYDIVLNGLKI